MWQKTFVFLLGIGLVAGCFNFQDHEVTAPEEPYYRLSGQVLDIDSGTPLPEIIVIVGRDSVISDSLGFYEFPAVKSGPHTISVVREQYLVFSHEIMMPFSERIYNLHLPKLIFAQTMGQTVTSFSQGICWNYETLALLDFLQPTDEMPFYSVLIYEKSGSGGFVLKYDLQLEQNQKTANFGITSFFGSYWTFIRFDAENSLLTEITKSGNIGQQIEYPYFVQDLTFDGKCVWVTNARNKIVKAQNLNGPFDEFDAPGSGTSGIACFRDTFWVSDNLENLIFKMNSAMEVVTTYKPVGDRRVEPELFLEGINQLACDSQGNLWGIGASYPIRRYFRFGFE